MFLTYNGNEHENVLDLQSFDTVEMGSWHLKKMSKKYKRENCRYKFCSDTCFLSHTAQTNQFTKTSWLWGCLHLKVSWLPWSCRKGWLCRFKHLLAQNVPSLINKAKASLMVQSYDIYFSSTDLVVLHSDYTVVYCTEVNVYLLSFVTFT